MQSAARDEEHDRSTALVHAARRLAGTAAFLIGARASRIVAAYRTELHRAIAVFALSLAATFFVCAAAAFGAFALFMALWDSHRVLAPVFVGAGFVILALIAALAIARRVRSPRPFARQS